MHFYLEMSQNINSTTRHFHFILYIIYYDIISYYTCILLFDNYIYIYDYMIMDDEEVH